MLPTESLVDMDAKVLVQNKPGAIRSSQEEAETKEHLRGEAQCTMSSYSGDQVPMRTVVQP
ncbi:hypothetical protein N7530_010100 [Penicillium desertorum]|jgi:hypothetical protein|uniref:Uncharacterized protein n=1 Tax=Penicillium desertorum TaxID=1303715 RepID=A0A9W9WJP6_9EURO|nr:hypothetical protein N7530_010100 [Penicillium desertorum]